MISVTENGVETDVIELLRGEGFDGCLRCDGDECGGVDGSMWG